MLPRSFLLRAAPGLGLFLPRLCAGFLPLLAAAAPLASGLMGGGALGGGGSPGGPISTSVDMGAVSFGAKYIGDSAVKTAPAVIAAENTSWTKHLPWIVGGVVALLAGVFFAFSRRRK